MKSKKYLSLALIASMIATIATSCGSSNSGSSDSASADSGSTNKITITFRDDGLGEDGSGWKWFQNAYDNWDQKDGVQLDIAPITAGEGDYFTKIALALQSESTAPDLVMEDTFQLPTDALAGYLTDMTSMVEGWEDWSSDTGIIESIKSGVTVDGKVYGVPYNTDTRGLWYNKEILEQAGLDAENWAPKSWDELLDDLRTIKEKVPDVVPLWMNSGIATGEATTMQTYQMLLYGTGNGGKETMYEGDKWVVESQGILDTLTFIQTVYKEELGPPLSKILDANGSNTGARDYIPNGKAAVILDGNWITGNYKEGGASEWAEYADTLAVAPMPNQDGTGTVTLAGGWALAIPEKSDNKQTTFEFIKQCMSTDIYTPFIIESGSICTRQDTSVYPAYIEEPFMGTATKLLSGAHFRPINDEYPSVSTAVQTMVESVVTQSQTPEQAMKQYKIDVVRVTGEDRVVSK